MEKEFYLDEENKTNFEKKNRDENSFYGIKKKQQT